MAIRAEVTVDLRIRIMRPMPETGEHIHVEYDDLDDALLVIKAALMTDLELARKERFVPQIEKEGAKAYKELSQKSPYSPDRK
jgi:cell division protein ZapA (FtsZ GTPase activity inhibitor)